MPLSSVLPGGTSSFEDEMIDTWAEDDFDSSEDEKPSYNLPISEDKTRKLNGQTKWKDVPKPDMKSSHSDDDLNALLQVICVLLLRYLASIGKVFKLVLHIFQEEEDLVNAHRKQVEDTMNIVREEMNLLVEADQPGNQLDDYVTRLNAILSQKAAGILQLQNRLAHFQRRLKEHNVLVSSSGY